MENKIVIAVIGCGRIAQNAHFPAFSQMDNIRVKYACDLIEEKANAMKEKYAFVENVITDYKIALADNEVDCVYVLTPNYAHYTVTMDALRAGKHVFCEKPITVNYALSKEMEEEAEKQNKILNIGVCNRFNKSVEMLEEMNREGKFGNIYHVYCSFRAFRSIPGLGGDFTTKSQSGGGVLIDWGVHFLDLILYVLGGAKIRNLTCDAYCEMAKGYRYFKLCRIEKYKNTGKKFSRDIFFKESDYFDNFGMTRNSEDYHIKLQLFGAAAMYVKDYIYGKNQKITNGENGSTILEVDLRYKSNVVRFVMQFVGECKVIEPEWLKEDVKNTCLRIINSL